MILGVGSDMIDIRRVEKTLARFGSRFEQRVFTETERQKAARRGAAGSRALASTYAKRFAAKEACSKALGTGLRQGVFWRDMGVTNLKTGQPTLTLSGGAKQRLQQMLPEGKQARIDLTLSDDYPTAFAMVIISVE